MTNVYTPVDSSFKLVLDDEFNGNSLDTNVWSPGWFLSGTGLSGPVNGAETAVYNSNLVSVSGGDAHLDLIASPATRNGKTYPFQGSLIEGNGFQHTYGYFEARVYFPPASPGVIANWPIWWMDGQNWPVTGEIDIAEGLSGKAQSTFHNSAGAQGLAANGDFTGWHVFGALWEPGKIDFYYDGQLQHEVTSGVTGAPMQMILNNSTGQFGGPTVTPSDMLVDYVHVYQNNPGAVAVTPQSGYGGPGDTGDGTPPPPPPPPVTLDTLILHLSEDKFGSDAQFIAKVDGTQIGAGTVSTLHSSGQSQDFTFQHDWADGTHAVEIDFTNGRMGGGHDRNLWVDQVNYDGVNYGPSSPHLIETNGGFVITVGQT